MNINRQFPKLVALAVCAIPAWSQNPDNWNRFNQPAAQTAQAPANPGAEGPGPQTDPVYQQAPGPQQGVSQQGVAQQGSAPQPPGNYSQRPMGQPQGGFPHFPQNDPGPAPVAVPPALTVPAGKYITVRTVGILSSDHNQPGDAFSATLAEPLVVDGFVVAQRGQTVNGRVVDVEKAGRVKGTSSMRVELTELNLVDGQQLPFKSQLVYRKGETSIGRDAVGIGTTTAVGAAIGAGVNGGVGAGVGAGAGLIVGLVGVLVTRGRPTVIYPETALTFRVEAPITISTVRSANAFVTVSRRDYERPVLNGPRPGPGYYGGAVPPPVAYAYPYPYYGGFYGGPFFYGRFGYGYRRW